MFLSGVFCSEWVGMWRLVDGLRGLNKLCCPRAVLLVELLYTEDLVGISR